GGPDHVGVADRVDGGHLLAACGASDELAPGIEPDPARPLGALGAAEGLAAREQLDHVELVLGAVVLEEPFQLRAPRGGEEALAACPGTYLTREAEGRPAEILVVGPRHLERAFQ